MGAQALPSREERRINGKKHVNLRRITLLALAFTFTDACLFAMLVLKRDSLIPAYVSLAFCEACVPVGIVIGIKGFGKDRRTAERLALLALWLILLSTPPLYILHRFGHLQDVEAATGNPTASATSKAGQSTTGGTRGPPTWALALTSSSPPTTTTIPPTS